MSITGITGDIGSGKSFKMLGHALEMAEARKKGLLFNFPLNYDALLEYARLKKYHWIEWLIKAKRIKCIRLSKSKEESSLASFLKHKDCIAVLDESGIFLSAREWASCPKDLLTDLCQSRKDGIDLIWAAQFSDQVDKNFRMLTQFWIHADSITRYSQKTKKPELVYKLYYHFTAAKYNRWATDNKARANGIRTRFLFAFRTDSGMLNDEDKKLFACFDSFARLEAETIIFGTRGVTFLQRHLLVLKSIIEKSNLCFTQCLINYVCLSLNACVRKLDGDNPFTPPELNVTPNSQVIHSTISSRSRFYAR